MSARLWLTENKHHAPPDYGPIMPPGLRPAAVAWQARMAEAGYVFFEMSEADKAEWLAECAAAGVPPVLNMVGLVLTANALLTFGTESQRELLAPTGRGDIVWCQLFSEPGAGSDLGSLSTAAVLDGDEYVVNGQKTWSSGASASDWGILLARTDPDAPKHKGISFFVVDMSSPGIEVRPIKQMTGESEFDEVFFTDVRVPAGNLVGPLHGGWGVTMATLGNERAYIGSSAASLQRRLHAISTTPGVVEIAAVRDHWARLYSQAMALSWMDVTAGPLASLVKLGVTEASFEYGVSFGDALAAPGARLGGGSSEVQRNIIGELVLGLPKEPRPA